MLVLGCIWVIDLDMRMNTWVVFGACSMQKIDQNYKQQNCCTKNCVLAIFRNLSQFFGLDWVGRPEIDFPKHLWYL